MKSPRVLLLGFLLICGCGTEKPFRGAEYEESRRTEVLPYTVRVKVEPRLEGEAVQGPMVPSIVTEEQRQNIEEAVVEALRRYRSFAASHASDAAVDPDMELVIDIRAPAGRELGEINRNNLIWANLFLWLLAGFPGWLLEDMEVSPEITVNYRVVRTLRGGERYDLLSEKPVSLKDEERLNFWERAGIWQYVQQIIIPPFLVSPNKEVADRSLTEGYVARIQRDIGESVKRGVDRGTLEREGEALPFFRAGRNGINGQGLIFLLSVAPVTTSKLVVKGANGSPEEKPITWIDLNGPEGEKFAAQPGIASAIASDAELQKAFTMFKTGTYQQGYALEVDRSLLEKEDNEEPTRVVLGFRPDEKEWNWTWTPRLTKRPPES